MVDQHSMNSDDSGDGGQGEGGCNLYSSASVDRLGNKIFLAAVLSFFPQKGF